MKYIIALILPICIIGSAHSYYGYNNPRYGYDYLDSGYDYNQQLVRLLSGDPTAEFLYNGFYDDLTSESIQALASGIAVNLLSPLQQYVPIDAVVSVPTFVTALQPFGRPSISIVLNELCSNVGVDSSVVLQTLPSSLLAIEFDGPHFSRYLTNSIQLEIAPFPLVANTLGNYFSNHFVKILA